MSGVRAHCPICRVEDLVVDLATCFGYDLCEFLAQCDNVCSVVLSLRGTSGALDDDFALFIIASHGLAQSIEVTAGDSFVRFSFTSCP